jgi:mRNA interferase RelE/StbE
MKRYTVIISKSAAKYLSKLSGKMYSSIRTKISELETNPFPPGATAIQGYQNTYRLRAGGFRIVYTVYESELIIDVIDIASRGQVYNDY